MMRKLRRLIHSIMMFMMPKKISDQLMTCEEVSHIIAENTKTTMMTNFKFKMHLLICQDCVDYSKQLNVISIKTNQLALKISEETQNSHSAKSKDDLIKRFSSK